MTDFNFDWDIVTFDDRPDHGPHCPGIDTHPWRISIEEGKMNLTSGCAECDEAVMGPAGGEDVHMVGEIVGTLRSHLETYQGLYYTEYDHWWEFVPTTIEPEDVP